MNDLPITDEARVRGTMLDIALRPCCFEDHEEYVRAVQRTLRRAFELGVDTYPFLSTLLKRARQ